MKHYSLMIYYDDDKNAEFPGNTTENANRILRNRSKTVIYLIRQYLCFRVKHSMQRSSSLLDSFTAALH